MAMPMGFVLILRGMSGAVLVMEFTASPLMELYLGGSLPLIW
jgi:hypothetical protein